MWARVWCVGLAAGCCAALLCVWSVDVAEACSRAFLKPPTHTPPHFIATNGLLFGVLRGTGIAMSPQRPVMMVTGAGQEIPFRVVPAATFRPLDVLKPEAPAPPMVAFERVRGWDATGVLIEHVLLEPIEVGLEADEVAYAAELEVKAEVKRATWRDRFAPCGAIDMTLLHVSATPQVTASDAERALFHVYAAPTPEGALAPETLPTMAFLRVAPDTDDAGSVQGWSIYTPEGGLGGVGVWVSVAMVDRSGNVGPRSAPRRLELSTAVKGGGLWMVALFLVALGCVLGLGWMVWLAPKRAVQAHEGRYYRRKRVRRG